MINHGFVRFVWGDTSANGLRDGKLYKDINNSLKNESFPFVIYVLGKDNFKYLTSLNFNCVLVHDDPVMFDLTTQQWAHKLYLINYAMQDYCEMVYLDWDCVATCDVHDGVWDILGQKETFQANLFLYKTKKCLWRDHDTRKTCNGGFIYIRDKTIPSKLISNYNDLLTWTMEKQVQRQSIGKDLRFREKCLIYDDEPAITKYVDNFWGEWKGSDAYWELFEPEVSNVKKRSVYSKEKLESKQYPCFIHNL